MKLVRASALLACAASAVLLAGCSGDEQPAVGGTMSGRPPATSSTGVTTTTTTGPSSATPGAPATTEPPGIDNGVGSASRELAFSIANPAPCSPKTVPQANGPQCYRLGEQLLSAPLVGAVKAMAQPSDPAHWQVQFTLVSKFKDAFSEITKKNVGKQLAITFEGKVLSAPRIESQVNTGTVIIAGNFTKKQAQDLAGRLG